MILTDLERAAFGFVLLAVSASIVGVPQAVAQLPKVSEEPAVQQMVEAQLARAAAVRLDPNARVASVTLTARPLSEILDAVAKSGGMTFRYAAGMTALGTSSTVTLSDSPVEDALRAVLERHALTFQAMGPTTAFIYPDTPANRLRYTATIRVFPIAKADTVRLAQQLNIAMKPTADGFRAMVLTVADSRTIIIRAVPELVDWIATWIAEHDKDHVALAGQSVNAPSRCRSSHIRSWLPRSVDGVGALLRRGGIRLTFEIAFP